MSYLERSTGTVVITVNTISQRGLTIVTVGAESVDRRETERLRSEESSILIRVPAEVQEGFPPLGCMSDMAFHRHASYFILVRRI